MKSPRHLNEVTSPPNPRLDSAVSAVSDGFRAAAEPGVRKYLELSQIRLDGGTQPRAEINLETVAEYAEGVAEQAKFPPVMVFFDGAAHWLADGFHRYHGTKQAGFPTILAEICNGTKRDAVLYGLGANTRHGLRESRADKRRKIEVMLRDEEWVQWADRVIGRHCGVDHKTVAAVRAELVGCGEIPQIEARTVERNGTVYTQSVCMGPAAPDDGASVGHGEVRDGDMRNDIIDRQQAARKQAEPSFLISTSLPVEQRAEGLAPAVAARTAPQEMVAPQQQADRVPAVASNRRTKAEPHEPPTEPLDSVEVEGPRAQLEALRAELDALREQNAELRENLDQAVAENDAMAPVFEADDRLAAATAELKRMRDQIRVLNLRIEALMNERNAATREAQRWKAKAEAAEKRREEA